MLTIRKFKHKNIIIYSGNIHSAIRKIIKEAGTNDSEDTVVTAVAKFIELPILKFNERQDYQDSLVELISKKHQPSLENRFLKLLYTHENMIFNSCYPPFAGKTFGEIVQTIED